MHRAIRSAARLAPSSLALIGALAAAMPVAAGAADLAPTPVRAVWGLPVCADDGVLATIRDRFADAAATIEHRVLALAEITAIREVTVSVDDPSPIPRRWCTAAVTLTDGSRSTLSWRVEAGTGFAAPGFASLPSGLEFCVAGHDPWHVHDGACRTTRRFW